MFVCSERSRSDDSFLNYIKTMNKPKPVPKVKNKQFVVAMLEWITFVQT